MQSNLLDKVFEKSFVVKLCFHVTWFRHKPKGRHGRKVMIFMENKELQQTRDMYPSQSNQFLQMIKNAFKRNLTLYYDKTASWLVKVSYKLKKQHRESFSKKNSYTMFIVLFHCLHGN